MRLIDADALIELVEDSTILGDGFKQAFCAIVRGEPTIEPERKTGKWIDIDTDESKYDEIKCPCCKHIFTVDAYHWTDIGFVKDDLKFCPNCGSKMEVEHEQ